MAPKDCYRESTQSWRELLGQPKTPRPVRRPSYLAVVDRLQEEYRPFAQQRCWVHKTANTSTNAGSDLSFFQVFVGMRRFLPIFFTFNRAPSVSADEPLIDPDDAPMESTFSLVDCK